MDGPEYLPTVLLNYLFLEKQQLRMAFIITNFGRYNGRDVLLSLVLLGEYYMIQPRTKKDIEK